MNRITQLLANKNIYYFLSAMLWLIIIYKGSVMSMTHDESTSFYHLHNKNVFLDLFDSNAWGSANNHWLNTILFQLAYHLFGSQEWSIRLFSMLSFIVYAYFTIKLLSEIDNSYLRLAGFFFIVANPYLLDFFSTARGYGLSLAFSSGALYYGATYLQSKSYLHLAICLTGLLLATLSLFSSVIYFPTLIGAILLILLWQNKSKLKELITPILVIGGFGIVTIVLTITPIRTLSKNAEFKWGAQTLLESLNNLITHSAYSKGYVPNGLFMSGFLSCFLLFAYILIFSRFDLKAYFQKRRVLLLASTTFLGMVILMYLARHITDTYYPLDRKSIMFIPLLGIICFGAIDLLHSEKIKSIFGVIISLLLVTHFILSINFTNTREWWYEENTKDMVKRVVQDGGDQSSIGTNWLFHPTISFYNQNRYDEKLKVHNYNKEIDTMQVYDYFLCFDSDYEVLKSRYVEMYRYPSGRMILKKR